MVTPEQAMNRLNRDVGAAVRPLGFRGSRGTWILTTPDGIAQVGTGRRSLPAPGGRGTIFVGVGYVVVPLAWWEYVNWRGARWGQPAIPLDKHALSHRIGFVEARRRPDHDHYHMKLDPDAYPANVTTADELERAAAALGDAAGTLARTAIDLLRPGRYLEAMLGIDDIGYGMWESVVVLLAERGPSPQLDRAIDDMCDSYAASGAERPEQIIHYARTRAGDKAAQ
ncbi:hypothetical protein [Dactylosporangium sp. CA-139066]|uniref:hypothetical protein n=1 Tax=Dactylosporangium sp. CA-139066 TaxID=3239930 RepID=UPI003D943729